MSDSRLQFSGHVSTTAWFVLLAAAFTAVPISAQWSVGAQAGAGSVAFSMVGGGGLSTRLGSATPFVNGRLAIGLARIDDTDAVWQRANRAFVIMAGFTLPVPTRASADPGR